MSITAKITEVGRLNKDLNRLSDLMGVKLRVWIDALPTGGLAAIAQARLEYEEVTAMWMDAHERLAVLLREIMTWPLRK